jgi:hypothetical protein
MKNNFDWRRYAETPREFMAKLNAAKFTKAKPNNKGIVGTFHMKTLGGKK